MALEVAEPRLAFSDLKWKKVEVSRIYDDGFVLLKEDPGPWIERNLPHSLSIRTLELFSYDIKSIGESIAQLAQLTHLSIYLCSSLKCVSNNVMKLHNLQVLEIKRCPKLEELPANLGELRNLTHLQLHECRAIKCLPKSIGQLSNLSNLIVQDCNSLIELPANLGDLRNLTHLQLDGCDAIKCLPNSITQLSKLSTLKVGACYLLEELPANLGDLSNLTHLQVSYCNAIKYLPNSITHLSKLSTLIVDSCPSLKALPAIVSVVNMTLNSFCRLSELCLFNFTGLRNLQRLWLYLAVKKLPLNLDEVPQLVLLDVSQCVKIKYLPSNIKDLRKLHVLYLPSHFILETLPPQLNDSVIISVEGIHIRKTWKELKLDMGPKFIEASPPLVDMVMETAQNCSSPSACGFLSLKEDPSTWILNHYNLCSMVRLLDLQLHENIEKIAAVIWALPNLTHLYISAKKYCRQKLCLPNTITRLNHLSLDGCDVDYLSEPLGNLSNLKSLDLSLATNEPMESSSMSHFQTISLIMESLVSLEHLTLRCLDSSLPNSLAKLCNLNTLELRYCHKVSSFPENMNISKLKLVNCSVESLPSRLCHLEIVHGILYCSTKCGKVFEIFLMKLPVNLKTLSLTCCRVEYLPSITALHLQIILFKKCGYLRGLMPNIDQLVELCTLDISDTSIESLPECITRLPKLQHLVLPKCFKPTNLPHEFLRNDSNLKIEHVDDGIQREIVKEGIIKEQSSSCQLPIPPEGLEDPQSSKNPPSAHQKGNRQKIEITREQIQSLRDINMSLVEAGKKLGVSRSTLKRRCKDLKLGEWPSSKKKKSDSSKNINSKSHSGDELPQPNFVACINPAVPEYAHENLNNLSDQVAPKCVPFDKSTSKATTECVKEINVATQSKMEFHGSIPECTIGTNVHPLVGIRISRMSTGNFPWRIDVPDFVLPYIKGWVDVAGDGNCGFRVIAEACLGDQKCWPFVRWAMSCEIQANVDQYTTLYGGSHGPREAISRISGHMYGQAPSCYWIDTPLDLFSASTYFNVAFIMLATSRGKYQEKIDTCATILPLRLWSGARVPYEIVGIAHVNANHYVLVYLSDNCPLPPLCYKWEKSRHELVAEWQHLYANRMSEWIALRGSEWIALRGNVDQHNQSDQVAPQYDVIDLSTPNPTIEIVKDLNVANQSHMDVHESTLEDMVARDPHPLLGNVQDNSSSSSFVVKATYKEDIVKFKLSSTACLKELKEAVVENLKIKVDSFKLKYMDEEEDWVLINTNEHLESAVSLIKNNILRLKVTDL